MANFIRLLRAQLRCFGNSRFILGNPWKQEPYGYCCADGRRWDLYRWYPDPTHLTGPEEGFAEEAAIALRPFQVVLLEVVPHGALPSLDRQFPDKPMPSRFAKASRTLTVNPAESTGPDKNSGSNMLVRAPASQRGGPVGRGL